MQNTVYSTNECEETYVKNTYNVIAESFDKTRYSVWKCTKEFINKLDNTESLLEVGCGNGKNLLYAKEKGLNAIEGCDFSSALVKISQEKGLNVIESDILNLPYADKSFDNTMCIAVIHHLSTEEHRRRAISELIRVTKNKIFVTVNSFEQFNKSFRNLDTAGDVMVGWTDKGGEKYERFYHLFEKDELENLFLSSKFEGEISSGYELGNYYVILSLH